MDEGASESDERKGLFGQVSKNCGEPMYETSLSAVPPMEISLIADS